MYFDFLNATTLTHVTFEATDLNKLILSECANLPTLTSRPPKTPLTNCVSSTMMASSLSRLPSIERSLMFAEPISVRRSSTIISLQCTYTSSVI